jgi:hypothetical protein
MKPMRNAEVVELLSLLREPSRWPEGFEWYYPDPARCALGLFAHTHPDQRFLTASQVGSALGMKDDDALKIFNSLDLCLGLESKSRVTAAMVADAIEGSLDGEGVA